MSNPQPPVDREITPKCNIIRGNIITIEKYLFHWISTIFSVLKLSSKRYLRHLTPDVVLCVTLLEEDPIVYLEY